MSTDIEQQSLDIDWFFIAHNKIGFVASGGGKLQKSVSDLVSELDVLSSYFRSLPEKTTVVINNDLMGIKNITDSYLSDFVYFAKRGLYAFDKVSLNDFSDTNYCLVASPLDYLIIDDLSPEILALINSTILDRDISSLISSAEVK